MIGPWVLTGFIWVLSLTGFGIAFTIDPDAINMGIGCLIPAIIMTVGLAWPK